MADEFDDLKVAMRAATPAPDAARKAENLRLAEEIFVARQGMADGLRHRSELGGIARLRQGVTTMLNAMTTRGGLTATTALVAVGVFFVTPTGRDMLTPPRALVEPEIVVTGEASGGRVQGAGEVRQRDEGLVLSDDADGSLAANEVVASPQVADRGEQDFVVVEEMVLEEPSMEAEAFASAPVAKGLVLEQSRRVAPQSDIIMIAPESPVVVPEGNTEEFSNAETSSLKVVTEEPVSTFSIDVDTASYAVVRSSLTLGALPPKEAVRVEEMVNYFPYSYAAPDGIHPFKPTITVMDTPWNPGTDLVHIGIQGELPAISDRPPLNLVFLIDTSGSMQDAS
jgi:Ca-activated chloride channel family protein